MHVLALDTATPAVTAGVVELTADGYAARSVRVVHDARKHAELLMPGVLAACDEAGIALADLSAVVTGAGPGPFTGLRVGMVTAAALGDALGIPVHGVCSLDAIAHGLGPVVVVTDARRREVYWSAYDHTGTRVAGPGLAKPADLDEAIRASWPDAVGWDRVTALSIPAWRLGALAADRLTSGAPFAEDAPLYLRDPDVTMPGAPKRVKQ